MYFREIKWGTGVEPAGEFQNSGRWRVLSEVKQVEVLAAMETLAGCWLPKVDYQEKISVLSNSQDFTSVFRWQTQRWWSSGEGLWHQLPGDEENLPGKSTSWRRPRTEAAHQLHLSRPEKVEHRHTYERNQTDLPKPWQQYPAINLFSSSYSIQGQGAAEVQAYLSCHKTRSVVHSRLLFNLLQS